MNATIHKTSEVPFYILIIGVVVFLPFLWTSTTLDPVLHPRFIFLALLTAVTTIILFFQRNHVVFDSTKHDKAIFQGNQIVFRFLFLFALLYWLYAILSCIRGPNSAEAIFEISKIGLWIAYLYLASLLIAGEPKRILHLGMIVTSVLIIHCIIGIFQYYDWDLRWIPGNGLPRGIMAGRIHFAAFLLFALPFIFYTVINSKGGKRVLTLISLTFVCYNIIIVFSRAVFLGIIFAGSIVVLLGIFNTRKRTIPWKRILSITVIIGLLLVIALITGDINIDLEDDGRFIVWKKTVKMIADHSLWGVGIGNWKIIFPQYGVEEMMWQTASGIVHFQRPHNDFLWTWAETGIFGLVAYLAIFAISIYYAFRLWFHAPDKCDRSLGMLILFGLISYVSIAMFVYPRERIVHIVFMSLMISVVVSVYHRVFPIVSKSAVNHLRLTGKNDQRKHTVNRGGLTTGKNTMFNPSGLTTLLLVLCLFISIAAAGIGFMRLKGEIHTKDALIARAADMKEAVIAEIAKARSNFYTVDPTAAPLAWYSGVAHFSLDHLDEAAVDFEQAYLDHPNHMFVLNNLATCCELKGDHDRAIELYKQVLYIAPHLDEALINLSLVYNNIGQYQMAYKMIKRCNPDVLKGEIRNYMDDLERKVHVENTTH